MTIICLFFATNWQWPVDTNFGLTATFGEYRGDHYHMGVDFSTNGAEGLQVRPAAAGKIYRIRAQKHGYGRVVYVKHNNGFSSVYAHLGRFEGELRDLISARGLDPDSNFGTLYLSLELGKDSVFAQTGESGAGLPHFHFEIRKPNGHAVDPLSLSFPALNDQPKPLISNLILIPGEAGTVNGFPWPQTVDGNQSVWVDGPVFLEVTGHLNGKRGSRLGVQRVELIQNGRILAAWHPATISFDDYKTASLVFNQAYSGFSPTHYTYRFHNLENKAPLPGFTASGPLMPGHYQIKMTGSEKQDVFLDLKSGTPPLKLGKVDWKGAMPNTLVGQPWLNKLNWVPQKDATVLRQSGMHGLSANELFSFQPLAKEQIQIKIGGATLSREVGLMDEKGRYQVGPFSVEWETTGESGSAWVLEPADPRIQADELAFVSPVLKFGQEGFTPLACRVFSSTPDEFLGLFAWHATKSKWVYWGDPGEGVQLDYLTTIVLARDLVDPTIGSPRYHDFLTGQKLLIPLRDRQSGIDPDGLSIQNKAGQVSFEYDRDRQAILLSPNTVFPLNLVIADRAGRVVRTSITRKP